MSSHPAPDARLAESSYQILDRLTVAKLRIGSLRGHLRRGEITPEEIDTHLALIEQDIDATAAVAQDMQASGARSGERGRTSRA